MSRWDGIAWLGAGLRAAPLWGRPHRDRDRRSPRYIGDLRSPSRLGRRPSPSIERCFGEKTPGRDASGQKTPLSRHNPFVKFFLRKPCPRQTDLSPGARPLLYWYSEELKLESSLPAVSLVAASHLISDVTHLFAVSNNSQAEVTRKQGCGHSPTPLFSGLFWLSCVR